MIKEDEHLYRKKQILISREKDNSVLNSHERTYILYTHTW